MKKGETYNHIFALT